MEKQIRLLWIAIAAVFLLNLGTIAYFRSSPGPDSHDDHGEAMTDVPLDELLTPGPLEEMSIGDPTAPNVIVEYASMTCSHCAAFHTKVFPELKRRFIDTGKVRFIFREFPLDGLAASVFMLARCSGKDNYFATVDVLFKKQKDWLDGEGDARPALLSSLGEVGGFTKESLDKCLEDEALFTKIVEVRRRANDEYKVSSTPSFFVNGKALDHPESVEDFVALFEE